MMKAGKQVVVIALTVPIVLLWSWAWAGEAQVVKIGVQLPLVGERAQVGKDMQNGVKLALDALNSRMPRDGATMEVVFEDDGNTKEGALNALNKLIRDPQVVAVIVVAPPSPSCYAGFNGPLPCGNTAYSADKSSIP